MIMHISLYDYSGASALYERAIQRFKPDDVKKTNVVTGSNLEMLWTTVGVHMEQYAFDPMIQGLNELVEKSPGQFKQVAVMLLFYQIPKFFRASYSQVSKQRLSLVLDSKFVKSQKIVVKPEDLGFNPPDKDGFLQIDPQLDNQASAKVFTLDA